MEDEEMRGVCQRLAVQPEPTLSFEVFPPRDLAAARRYDSTLPELLRAGPDWVSVTYGANGSNREGTLAAVAELRRDEVRTFGHLTCASQSREEVLRVAETYCEMGADLMVIRGDPPEGPTAPWVPHSDGFTYTQEVVKEVRRRDWSDDACLAVAAFPTPHLTARDAELDAQVLATKFAFGACMAVTQLFWHPDDYGDMVARTRRAGGRAPIVPGLLVPTSNVQLERVSAMVGSDFPHNLWLDLAEFGAQAGVDYAVELAEDLLAAGAGGLHFYTMNSTTCLEVVDRLKERGWFKTG